MYDLVIIGGGPAGVGAGVYAARKKIKTLFITDTFGGQSLVSSDVQNWIGTKSVSGYDLGKMLEEHLRAHSDIEILESKWVNGVSKNDKGFMVTTVDGGSYETRTVLLTSGSRRRKLDVPGEKELDGKGVAYCSTCDAPLFAGKIVAVIGGGNAGLEAVVDLLNYASKIYLLVRSEAPKGDPVTYEKIKNSSKVQIITMAQTTQVLGNKFVSGLKYKDLNIGEEKTLELQGVFVEIGALPNSDIVKSLVTLDNYGQIVVDHKTQRSSLLGIWAAGDVTDVLYKQNNISVGDAIKAVLNIVDYLGKE